MKLSARLLSCVAVSAMLLFSSLEAFAQPGSTGNAIASRTAQVDGLTLHYLTIGHGEPLILLHGYAETSRMWRPIMPQLAERFMVIAPDLPGIGDSAIPPDGMD